MEKQKRNNGVDRNKETKAKSTEEVCNCVTCCQLLTPHNLIASDDLIQLSKKNLFFVFFIQRVGVFLALLLCTDALWLFVLCFLIHDS